MKIHSNFHIAMAFFLMLMTACTAGVPSLNASEDNSASGRDAVLSKSKLLNISALKYLGAFRIPEGANGVSSMNYSQGPIAYDAGKHSIFLVGHAHQQAVAEYLVPEIHAGKKVTGLEMAKPAIQKFVSVLDRMSGGNPEGLSRIGGLARHENQLMVSAYEYYDAPADNSTTHLVINNARDLAGSEVIGPLSFQGRAHTAGWMSQIPDEWQEILGGTWLVGSSSGEPIIGRLSVGPSAFAFNAEDLNKKSTVETTTLLDFDLDNPLNGDLSNESGKNDIWTHMSRAVHGFIPPGSRTYITLGHSGGHNSSLCYKCIPDGGKENCYGYCATDPSDYHLMYWLWDVKDLIDVRDGEKDSYSIRPYDYGVFEAPFAGSKFGGGSYNPVSNRLYLTLQSADHDQGAYSNPPIVLVYSVEVPPVENTDRSLNLPAKNQ